MSKPTGTVDDKQTTKTPLQWAKQAIKALALNELH